MISLTKLLTFRNIMGLGPGIGCFKKFFFYLKFSEDRIYGSLIINGISVTTLVLLH